MDKDDEDDVRCDSESGSVCEHRGFMPHGRAKKACIVVYFIYGGDIQVCVA